MDPIFPVFAAICSILGAGVFSLLLPKSVDHFKDHNIRTIKELEEIKKGEDISTVEKERIDKIIKIRRASYLEKQENLIPEFENTYRINHLKNSVTNYENSTELYFRKKMAKKYNREFNKGAWLLFGGIALGSVVIVAISWMGASFIVQNF